MKVPLRWLREYVAVPANTAELVERLTLAGLEVTGVQLLGVPPPAGLHLPVERGPVWDPDKVFIGEVVAVERHPNADRLTLVTVHYGAGRTKTLVTGAPNLHVGDRGQKVALALAGAVLFDGHAPGKVLRELKPAKIRGVLSEGMVCSERELGLSEEHEGILLLEPEAPAGLPLVDYLGDIILEIEILPNMARCLGLIGIAREVAALTGQQLHLPAIRSAVAEDRTLDGQVSVSIAEPQDAARYLALLLEEVRVGPAPAWMQRRLRAAGMRPINNLVDITNYVMLEWGQPLHAFDYDRLCERAGGRAPAICVRRARTGEELVTLDGQRRILGPEHLVIADEQGPIALAGIMGGAATEVQATTRRVLLEAAQFHPSIIRRGSRQLGLSSEASLRFSRGIHPELAAQAARRAADLMVQLAGGRYQGRSDCYPAPVPAQVLLLTNQEVRRLLGVDLPQAEVRRILEALEFQVEVLGPEQLRVTTPPHRLDIQAGAADLVEEIARIYGFDRLPATLLADRLPPQQSNPPVVFDEVLRDLLVRLGLQEVITYSLTTPERETPLGLPLGEYVRLRNPISSERIVLRQVLLPGVLEVAAHNLRHRDDLRLFELGPVYRMRPGQRLPEEPRRLALVLTGRRQPAFWAEAATAPALLDFFDLKGIIETLVLELHLAEVRYRPIATPWLHPGQAAELWAGEQLLGSFGVLHPRLLEVYALGERVVLAAELDVEALQAVTPRRHRYQPIPRFPAARRDLAVVVAEEVPAEQIVAEIRQAGGALLRQVRLFDLYRGPSIPPGTKSLAYTLLYQAEDHTLTDKEVDRLHRQIAERLQRTLQAQIRGQEQAAG
jgi:phenylalanyl-tRNA synthetase beta chain